MTAATSNELLKLFFARQALLEGHFILSSGLHSDRYLQCAMLLQDPAVAEDLGRRLAKNFEMPVDLVISPAIGGLIIGHETARAKRCRAIFTEKDEQGKTVLRRGFQIMRGERVLVVEDVVTTGLSTNEVVGLVKSLGGEFVGVGSIVNRGGPAASKLSQFGWPVLHSLLQLDVATMTPGDCTLCREGKIPAVKPGSRKK